MSSVLESPVLWVSVVWIVIAIIGSLLVRWTDDPALYRLAIWTGAFCLWLMWLIVYLSQMNPLVAPQIKMVESSSNSSAHSSVARDL